MDTFSCTEKSLKSIKRALNFIEGNLTIRPLSAQDIAMASYCSKWHLQEMFKWYTGLSLMEYCRIRRLSEIAKKLLETDKSIIDLALEYQFDSQPSFNRSFKKLFNVSPAKFRKTRQDPNIFEFLLTYDQNYVEKLEQLFEISRIESKRQSPTLVKMENTNFVGNQVTVFEDNIEQLEKHIGESKLRLQNMISDIMGAPFYPEDLYSVSHRCRDDNNGWQTELLGFKAEELYEIPQKWDQTSVTQGAFLEFIHHGKISEFYRTMRFIFSCGLPQTHYRYRYGPHINIFNQLSTDDESSIFRVLVPVTRLG